MLDRSWRWQRGAALIQIDLVQRSVPGCILYQTGKCKQYADTWIYIYTYIYVPKFSDTLNAGSLPVRGRELLQFDEAATTAAAFPATPSGPVIREKHRNDRRTVGDLIPLGMAKRPPTAHSKNRRVASKADLLCGLSAGFGHLIRHQTPPKDNDYSLKIQIVCSLVQFKYVVYLL